VQASRAKGRTTCYTEPGLLTRSSSNTQLCRAVEGYRLSAPRSTDRQTLPTPAAGAAAPTRTAGGFRTSGGDLARPGWLHEQAVYESAKFAAALGASVKPGHCQRVARVLLLSR
jgi:hypothetical protein